MAVVDQPPQQDARLQQPSDRDATDLLQALLLLEEALSLTLSPEACLKIRRVLGQLDLGRAPSGLGELLGRALRALRPTLGPDGLPILTAAALDGSLHRAAQEIRQTRLSLGGPKYVYHGTTLGRLESIKTTGLCPGGGAAVWQQDDLREHCASAVFFADSIGGAESWALCAFLRGRGRRPSRNRRPVVMRLVADGLGLLPDTHAAAPGCLMTSKAVDVSSAYCALAGGGWLPHWQGLRELIALRDLPDLPELYKTA